MKFAKILEVGVQPNMPIDQRRQVEFSNAVYLVVGGLLLAFNIIRFENVIQPKQSLLAYAPIIIVVVSALCLLLNYVEYFLLSRLLFVSAWILLIIVLPVVLVGPQPSTYFQHPYFGILFSPVVHLLFSYQRERFVYLFFVLAFFLLAAFSLDFLLYFDRAPEASVPLVKSASVFQVNLIVFWLFLNLLMVYVLRINRNLYRNLEAKNVIIKEQNLILDEQRSKLNKQNRDLESKVRERTLSLSEQNNKLKEYAFMHAHVLRAPIGRIKGLINLLTLTTDAEEAARIRKLIEESMNELDGVVSSMNKRLNESDQ